MESFDVKTILSIISLLLGGGLFFWVKVITKRAFTSIDNQFKLLNTRVDKLWNRMDVLEVSLRDTEKDIVKINATLQMIDEIKQTLKEIATFHSEVQDRYQRKSEFIRESQIIANQIEALHKKLEYLDAKMDRKGSS